MRRSVELLRAAATTVDGSAFAMPPAPGTIQASISGTGAVSATVAVDVRNDGAQWITIETLALSGTTSASSGFAYGARWAECRARVTAISGAGAIVNCVADA